MQAPQLFVGGRWIDTNETIPVINPSDGNEIGVIARGTVDHVDEAVSAGQAASRGEWGRFDAVSRGRLMLRLCELIHRDADRLARLESLDVGKPLSQARSDVAVIARYFEYYGSAADKVQGETIPSQSSYTVMTFWEPYGVTGHIVPWNYPLQMMGRSLAPSLAMGNAVVLKPAEDTSLTALALARLVEEAGFPAGSFNVVTGIGSEVGAALSRHPGIGHVSFTGSPEVGTLVQQAAAVNAVPVRLELGAKSPQVVFADAPLESAADTIVRGIAQNSGQTCAAGTRVLIESSIYDSFTSMLAERFKLLRAGPSDLDLDMGPVVNASQQRRIENYLALGRQDGLPVLAHGEIESNAPSGGFYVRPTLFGDVPANHRLAQEEIFGPVLVVIRFEGEDEALHVANNTPYGLAAGIWTTDLGCGLRLAHGVKSGQVFVNNYGAGGGVELPFGGVKRSGHGREKGLEALYGFATLKTIAVKHAPT
ncbi:MAG: aldehyde dehydrogenase family protein [Rhizobiaceae bacterium]|nr:aldehyde dehydrogenase family protein [Rhizobiaceae bacterium]